jgi:hypothetical protein
MYGLYLFFSLFYLCHISSKLYRKTNEHIRGKMDAQDTILDDITRKKSFGMDMLREWIQCDCQKLWSAGNLKEGKRGRPRKTCKDGIYTAMSERGLRMGEWNNRRQWNMELERRRQKF